MKGVEKSAILNGKLAISRKWWEIRLRLIRINH